MSEPTPSASEPLTASGTAAETFRLDGIPDTRDPIANLLSLLTRRIPDQGAQSLERFDSPADHDNGLPGRSNTALNDPATPCAEVSPPGQTATPGFRDEGDAILLLGEIVDLADPLQGLGRSTFLEVVHGIRDGNPSPVDVESAALLRTALAGLDQTGGLKSACACQSGGLAMALVHGCLRNTGQPSGTVPPLGAIVDLQGAGHASPMIEATPRTAPNPGTTPVAPSNHPATGPGSEGIPTLGPRLDALLFGENPARVLITCAPLDATCILGRARLLGVPATRLGTVGGQELKLKTGSGDFAVPVLELQAAAD